MDIDIQPGVIARVAGMVRDAIDAYGTRRGWFPPLPPLPQVSPPGTPPRRWDYPVGVNIQIQPRIQIFEQLRGLADSYDLLRLLIETVKDTVAKVPWVIRERKNPPQRHRDTERNGNSRSPNQKSPLRLCDSVVGIKKSGPDPRINKLTQLFQFPDREQPWDLWLRALLEDVLVIDAPTLEPVLTRGGDLYRLDLIDGATITPKVDYNGRTPQPPAIAYQQIIKGAPSAEFTADELIYYPRNRRTHKIYGYSPVEQVQLLTNLALRRELWLLNFFTEGNVPEAYAGVPDTWTPQQIKEAQDAFDAYLAGNPKNRRKVIFGPDGKFQLLKPGAVGGDAILDELIIRMFCFALRLSPQALVRMMNRATAETAKSHAAEEGLLPLLTYFANLFNFILRKYCHSGDLEFVWRDEKEEDTEQQAAIIKTYVSLGVMTVNESRDKLGLDPVPGGDVALVYTATGAVPLTAALSTQHSAVSQSEQQATIPQGGTQAGENLPQSHRDTESGTGNEPSRPAGGNAPGGATRLLGKDGGDVSGSDVHGSDLPGSYAEDATGAQRAAQERMQDLLEAFFAEQREKLAADVEAWATAQLLVFGSESADDSGSHACEPDDFPFDQAAWDSLAGDIAPELKIGFSEAAEQALKELDANDEELGKKIEQRAVQFAGDHAAELVSQISQTTRNRVLRVAERGLKEGSDPQQLKSEVEQLWLFDPGRAETIAGTEARRSRIQGKLAAWQESGQVLGHEWFCHVDACGECQCNAEASPVRMGERFPSGDYGPPVHPRCRCELSPVYSDEWRGESRGESRHRCRPGHSEDAPYLPFPVPPGGTQAGENLPQSHRDTESGTENEQHETGVPSLRSGQAQKRKRGTQNCPL